MGFKLKKKKDFDFGNKGSFDWKGTGNYDITTKTKDQSVKQADIVKKKKSIKK
tara:strand:- start:579 stop:737 length:159 start_codon:yes stop_codon:yes gene_type:complete